MKTYANLAGAVAGLLLWGAVAAQPAPPAPPASAPPIGHASVDEALAALSARDGNGTIVTHNDGWTIVAEPQAAAQWSFTPEGHPAHPAVVRRIIRRGPGTVDVQTTMLCEAPAPACAALQAEFEALSERIRQAVRARGRQGSTPPSPP